MTTLAAIDFEEGFNQAFQDGIQLLPKIGYFLLILIVGILVAKLVQGILTKVLQKVGFDRLVERGGIKQALSKSKLDAAGILARIVYYFIFLFVLSAAFQVFGDNPISDFLQQIIFFLPKIFAAVLIVVIAAAVAAAVKELLTNLLGGLSYGAALANGVSLFITAIGVFAALDQLEIAPLIVTGIFYALIALIVLPLIIAFGVGGIDPAREAIRNAQSQRPGEGPGDLAGGRRRRAGPPRRPVARAAPRRPPRPVVAARRPSRTSCTSAPGGSSRRAARSSRVRVVAAAPAQRAGLRLVLALPGRSPWRSCRRAAGAAGAGRVRAAGPRRPAT